MKKITVLYSNEKFSTEGKIISSDFMGKKMKLQAFISQNY